jgi:small subunit ribosomal protein S19
MARSLKKGAFFQANLLKKTKNKKDFKTIKIWSRSSTILPEFMGYTFEIHNGKSFISLKVIEEMVGHKFGEFASTRKSGTHKMKKGKK